ncbi:hypothetical protein [Streptomyces cavernae]|uniref:hypothetical protein n=1 Tax=Streptomyces cavernae TaxID=2259034 RepID=UPI000FEBA8B6|nr:hypothetical protein [Streptomyces cavernae]
MAVSGNPSVLTPPDDVSATVLVHRLTMLGLPAAVAAPVTNRSREAHDQGVHSGGLVIGWGTGGDLARSYADALGRPFLAVSGGREWPRAAIAAAESGSGFVVLPEEDFDFGTAGMLFEHGRNMNLPVGVLPLPMDRTEAAFLVARAWALRRLHRPFAHRTALYCDFRSGPPGGLPDAYGSAQAGQFLELLRTGVEAVVLHSHGNGADFRVGSHVLCLQADPSRPAPGRQGEKFLPCQGGGHCRLDHKTGFVAFHGASAVRTRLMVMLSCSAYQPHGGLLDPRFQFSRRLLTGRDTVGLVASTRINHGTPQLGVAVATLLRNGASLGEVALRVNALSAGGPPSYLCVGDPDLTLTATSDPHLAQDHDPVPRRAGRRRPGARTPPAPPPGSGPERAGPHPSSADSPISGPRPLEPAPRLLFASDMAAHNGDVGAARLLAEAGVRAIRTQSVLPVSDRRLARSLADWVAARTADATGVGPDEPAWAHLCVPAGSRQSAPCPQCARPVVTREHRSPLYRDYRRLVRRCTVDGLLADVPDASARVPRHVRHEAHRALVRWEHDGLTGACTLVFAGRTPGRVTVPASRGCAQVPPGACRVFLVHAVEGHFSVLRAFGTGEASGE